MPRARRGGSGPPGGSFRSMDPLAVRWTASRLAALGLCPRLHAFRYVERIDPGPDPTAPVAVLDALRAALAAFDSSGRPDDLWASLRARWPAGASTRWWARAVGAAGRRLSGPPAPASAVRFAFAADIGGLVVEGRVDRVDAVDGGERLVTYRLGEAAPEEEGALLLSAAALARSGRPVRALRVEDVLGGAGVDRPVAEDDLRRVVAEARAAAAVAAADRDARPAAGAHCARCAHALLCPAAGGASPARAMGDLLVLLRAASAASAAGEDSAAVLSIAAAASGAVAGTGAVALAAAGGALRGGDGRTRRIGPGLARVLAAGAPARAALREAAGVLDVAAGGDLLLPLGAEGLLVVAAAPVAAEAALSVLARTAAGLCAAAAARRRAETDALTGLGNRGAFDAALAAALESAAPSVLAMLDIDRFKSINDTRGHPAGDAALRGAAALLAAADAPAFRFGGEEFAALVAGDAEGAAAWAERLRESIAAAAVEAPGGPIRFTVSIGLARLGTAPGGDGGLSSEVLSAADAALYRAKAGGRDQVRAAWEVPEEESPSEP